MKIIITIDGGGTKTECLISDIHGNIIGTSLSGPSNIRNQGLDTSIDNIANSIQDIIREKDVFISVLVIGLPAIEEEHKNQTEEIKEGLLKCGKIPIDSKDRIFLYSDQEIAFLSGTDKKNGIVIISGTGSVVRGWNNGNEAKVGGWGYFADEGSAFWVGQQAYQIVTRGLDGREDRGPIVDEVIKLLEVNRIEDINKIIYDNPTKILPHLSIAVDNASKKNDRVAQDILDTGVSYLVLGVTTVIDRLKFSDEFPLVMVGGMFRSEHFSRSFKEKVSEKVKFPRFIIPQKRPVFGALKIAKKIYEKNT